MQAPSEIAIGIPTYQHGRFIGRTIESLLEQDVAPAEIVVSDNHSTDQTMEVLRRFESRIRVIRPPRHLVNYSRSWNYVVAHTGAPWVALLSSDDIALPNYVRTLQRGIEQSSDAVAVVGGWQEIDAEGRVAGSTRIVDSTMIRRAPENLLDQLTDRRPRFGSTAVRRDAWASAGGFPEALSVAGDTGLWLRLCLLGPFVYESEEIFQYRQSTRTPEQEDHRRRLLVEDHCHVFGTMIPQMADEMGVADQREIVEVARKCCLGTMMWASRIFDGADRGRVADNLAPFAARFGLRRELELLQAGRVVNRKPYGRARLFASDIAEFLKAVRPWRRRSLPRLTMSREAAAARKRESRRQAVSSDQP